jgi:AraC-like DNA-binding protein
MSTFALASLAFGDHSPNVFQSVSAAQAESFRLFQGLKSFEFLAPNAFQFKTAERQVGTMHIGALSTSDADSLFGDRQDPAFVLLLTGHACFEVERDQFNFRCQESAVLVPPGVASQVSGPRRSVAVARLDTGRLRSTLATMLGPADRAEIVDRPMAVPLIAGKVSHDEMFRAIFKQIDLLSETSWLLELSGLDDVFYRTLLLATHHEIFVRQGESRKLSADRRRLSRVSDYVMANLATRITLTDLERVGHMSRRTLHNAFLRAYGLSPMFWVREQRLLRAMKLLSDRSGLLSVTEVLYSCGFIQSSLFSAQYARRFGETPSATLARAKKVH